MSKTTRKKDDTEDSTPRDNPSPETTSSKIDFIGSLHDYSLSTQSKLPQIVLGIIYKIYRLLLQPFIAVAWMVHGLQAFVSRHPIVMLLLVIGTHFFTSIFNPFNLDRTGDENAAHFLNRISSPFYGGADRTAQEDIIVVLITPDDIRDYLGGGHWPPSYEAQLRILREIQRHDPTAIFLDMYYTTPQLRPGTPKDYNRTHADVVAPAWEKYNEFLALSDQQDVLTGSESVTVPQSEDIGDYVKEFADGLAAIRTNNNLGTPIFIGPAGDLGGPHRADYSALKPLRSFADDHASLESATHNVGSAYNQSSMVDISVTLDSVIYYPREMSDNIPKNGQKPAAHALYYEYCKDRVARRLANKCGTFEDAGQAMKALAVKWGYGYPNWINDRPKDGSSSDSWITPLTQCSQNGSNSRLRNVFNFFYESIFKGEREIRRRGLNRCFYHAAVRAEKLFSDLPDSQLKYLFEDKIVLIGSDQPALADNFDTPVHGVIPGVFIHAMALDNLITLGNRHHKVPGRRIGQMNSTELFSGIVLLIIAFLLYAVREKDMAMKAKGNSRYLYRWSRYLAIVIGFSVFSMYLAARIGNWPLGNIFEVGLSALSMIFILEVLANRPKLAQNEQNITS